jgi:replicative superfamily II helicase
MPLGVQTLAVGVNLREFFMVETRRTNQVRLAAHMVVIKGVHTYQNNASKEYSDLDVMQMLGRAGRPQFGFLSFLLYVHLTHHTFRQRWNCCHHVRNATRI